MRTLVRAHDEVPCITAIIPPRNPEEDFCTSAQPERSEGNPAVWGLSKRVRQTRPTPPYGDSQRDYGNRGPPSRMAPTSQRRKLASPHSLSGARVAHDPMMRVSGGGNSQTSTARAEREQSRRMGALKESPATGVSAPASTACPERKPRTRSACITRFK